VFVNGGTPTAATFANDSDIPVLTDRANIMGIKCGFWESKGFDWTAKLTDYDLYVNRLIGRDGARQSFNLLKREHLIFISRALPAGSNDASAVHQLQDFEQNRFLRPL
jgi:hypothetical protein